MPTIPPRQTCAAKALISLLAILPSACLSGGRAATCLAQVAGTEERNTEHTAEGGCATRNEAVISIIFSADVQSELEPCGCVEGMLGGLARHASFIRPERKETRQTLLLDAGDLLFLRPDFDKGRTASTSGAAVGFPAYLLPQLRAKAETLIQCYNVMHWDVLNVGDNDLALGLDFLLELKKKTNFDFISANLVAERESESNPEAALPRTLFEPYSIRVLGGLRVGIFGLLSKDVADILSHPEGQKAVTARQEPRPPIQRPLPHGRGSVVRILDPIETARRVVQELRPQVDVVICLAHLGLPVEKKLATSVPGIDIIIGGHGPTPLPEPLRVGKTIIVHTHDRGKFLGRLDLTIRDKSAPLTADTSEADRIDAIIKEYETKIQGFENEKRLTTDPAMQYRAHVRVVSLSKELERLRGERGKLKTTVGNSFSSALVPMDSSIPDDPEVAALVVKYKENLKNIAASAEFAAAVPAVPAVPPVPAAQGEEYESVEYCARCHPGQYEQWRASAHAGAYDILVKRNQQYDLECIGCHTTGFAKPGGFFSPLHAKGFEGIQCTTCHTRKTDRSDRLRCAPSDQPEAICLPCHTREKSPDFVYATYFEKIKHPGGVRLWHIALLGAAACGCSVVSFLAFRRMVRRRRADAAQQRPSVFN